VDELDAFDETLRLLVRDQADLMHLAAEQAREILVAETLIASGMGSHCLSQLQGGGENGDAKLRSIWRRAASIVFWSTSGWVRTDMGGPKAPLSPQENVTAMRRLIETFGPNQSGKFYNYDGREYPW
jgi:hypothetical protein